VGRGQRHDTPCSLSTRPSTRGWPPKLKAETPTSSGSPPSNCSLTWSSCSPSLQVTGFLADHLSWVGMLEGAALLTVLWSSWAVHSWLTNAVPAEDVIPARIVIFSAMAAMFVASLAVPGAFGQYGVLFGTAYFVVQLSQVLLYSLAAGSDLEQRRAILRLAPGFVGAPVLMIVAGTLDGFAQGALWTVALTVGYGVAFIRGVSGFRIHAGHFAERRLSAAQGEERARLARDSYSYLHLPMVAGIIYVALGVKQTLSHVGDPLGTIPAVALCGGVALYLLGHNAFRLREVGSVSVPRLVVTMLCLALIPLAVLVPSLITLVVLAMLLCGLAAFETATSREFRRALGAR
jgi:low temperature requirement protein LtrA